MIGRIHLKRTIKWTAGRLSVATRPFTAQDHHRRGCILVYHRVSNVDFVDPRIDDWNVAPATFERQIRALADFAEIIPLHQLQQRLQGSQRSDRPWVCLTFDDGFADFYHQAVPILTRYQAPATIFVPTAYVGSTEPMPFDRWGRENRGRVDEATWRAITWQELQQCIQSGWVSIGSHSHQHLNGSRCTAEQLLQEAQQSRQILMSRLGQQHSNAYAYPYGSTRLGQMSQQYLQAVHQAGYQWAVTTDLGLASPQSDPLAYPRIEAHPLDTPAVLRAKVSGALGPYYLTDRMRRSRSPTISAL